MSATRLRLMPVVMTAAAALLALKTIEISTHSSYLFVQPAAAAGAAHGGEEKPAVPDAHGSDEAANAKPRPTEKPPVDAKGELQSAPSAQNALTDALAKRREAIEAKASELEGREALLQAAEKRMDDRLAELKRIEQRIAESDKRRADEEGGKLKEIVTLYEGMKPKEAARSLREARPPGAARRRVGHEAPRALGRPGLMAPDAAQKLTVALARREVAPAVSETLAASELPKIEGRPTGR